MNIYQGRVRVLGRDEEENALELCRELWKENGVFSMDEGKVRQMLDMAFDRKGGILAGVGEKGNLQGLLLIVLTQFWYTTESHWEECFLYVLPQHRKSKNAVDLLNFTKWCADQTPYPLLIGITPVAAAQRKVLLYDRQLKSSKAAQDQLTRTEGMLEVVNSLSNSKNIKSALGSIKKIAEKKYNDAAKAVQEAETPTGYLFMYNMKSRKDAANVQ